MKLKLSILEEQRSTENVLLHKRIIAFACNTSNEFDGSGPVYVSFFRSLFPQEPKTLTLSNHKSSQDF